MTDTPELDRAIEVAEGALRDHVDDESKGPDMVEYGRTYARALVAELLRGMEDTEEELYLTWMDGFNAALAEIKRRAGILEGEG